MNFTYDLFEKTPNGELLWHGAVCGLKAVRKELTELARRTGNECALLDLQTHQYVERRRAKNQAQQPWTH